MVIAAFWGGELGEFDICVIAMTQSLVGFLPQALPEDVVEFQISTTEGSRSQRLL